jgi:hypothetical protein
MGTAKTFTFNCLPRSNNLPLLTARLLDCSKSVRSGDGRRKGLNYCTSTVAIMTIPEEAFDDAGVNNFTKER